MKRSRSLATLAAMALLAGCSAPLSVPPLTPAPTGERHVGKFVWYDLLTTDVAAAERFYGDLFGWEFTEGDDARYVVVQHNGRPIAGIARADRLEQPTDVTQWISTLSVSDVDAAVRAAVARGGTVVREPRDLKARGRFAAVTDPQGALVALATSPTGDPPDGEPAVGEWLWTELWTTSPDSAAAFYRAVAGYTVEATEGGVGRPYLVLSRDGHARAGVLQIDAARGVPPNWLPYVRVADAATVVAKVEALGGRILVRPSADLRNGSVALIADPSGAAVVVQQWPIPGEGRNRP